MTLIGIIQLIIPQIIQSSFEINDGQSLQLDLYIVSFFSFDLMKNFFGEILCIFKRKKDYRQADRTHHKNFYSIVNDFFFQTLIDIRLESSLSNLSDVDKENSIDNPREDLFTVLDTKDNASFYC